MKLQSQTSLLLPDNMGRLTLSPYVENSPPKNLKTNVLRFFFAINKYVNRNRIENTNIHLKKLLTTHLSMKYICPSTLTRLSNSQPVNFIMYMKWLESGIASILVRNVNECHVSNSLRSISPWMPNVQFQTTFIVRSCLLFADYRCLV